MGARRSLPLRELKDQCQLLAKAVQLRGLATEAELAPRRPGGPENADRGPLGWLRFFGQLHRFHARGDTTITTPQAPGVPPEFAQQDATGLEALRGAPQDVLCQQTTGPEGADGVREPIRLRVHPKGLGALTFLHARDWLLGWLAQRLAVLQERGTAEDADLAIRVHAEIEKQYGLVLWVVTHPGPGVPFPVDTPTHQLQPPDHLRALDPLDVLRVAGVHAMVNGQRLHAVRALLGQQVATEEPGSLRPSWTAFAGSLALELGLRPATLMWDWTLVELLTVVASRAAIQEHAQADAEAKAGAKITLGG